MTDLTTTIAPKSDQLNADDLIAGPRTITVTKVMLLGEADQPVAIHFENDQGKPFKPCKSMRRVLVQLWGGDGKAYAGRSMTLYRDPNVKFGGMAVGGIRISHMSHIDRETTLALTETRASKKPYKVLPLRNGRQEPSGSPRTAAEGQGATQASSGANAAPGLSERVERAVAALKGCGAAETLDAAWARMAGLREDVKADQALAEHLEAAHRAAADAFGADEPSY